jgi:predicted nucleic acid-binding protein
MSHADRVFLDAGIFIGALLADDPRHAEARGIVEAARDSRLPACTSVGVLAEVYAALTWVGALPRKSQARPLRRCALSRRGHRVC